MTSPSSKPNPQPPDRLPVPERLPVMILPGCTLLPHNILPLCIFEQRYRQMLKAALHDQRMFCIGMRRGSEESPLAPDAQPEDVHPHMTVGVIRACVANPDGTSNLLLQGVERVKLLCWDQVHPFRIARIEPLTDTGIDHPELPGLREALLEEVEELTQCGWDISPQLIHMLRHVDDHLAAVNVAGFHLLRCPEMQQELLATDSVPQRMRQLLEGLRRVKAGGGDEH